MLSNVNIRNVHSLFNVKSAIYAFTQNVNKLSLNINRIGKVADTEK